jgi:tripartite-type tricarboxylate transporter receptor subunit TctC
MRWLSAAMIMLAIGLQPTLCTAADADNYPTKPIRFIVPAPPGGASDILARILGQKLTESWGQQVWIDHRSGASGILGGDIAAKSTPDGYTILVISGLHTTTATLHSKLPYDPVKDFAAITGVASSPLILVVHPSVPARSVKELIAAAKAKPGQLSFGSAGSGAPSHLAGESFKTMAGVDLLHVPFKGAGQATSDLVGGHVSLIFNNPLSTIPLLKAGKVKALAVTSVKRSSALPDIPTVAESGLAGFEVTSWWGVLAPARTPSSIVAKLNAELLKILQMPEVKERLAAQAVEPFTHTPDGFAAFIRADIDRWAKVIKAAGIRAD